MSPAAQVAAAGAMKAYGEVSSHPGAPVVKAAGHAWAGAASAEPGASRWLTAGFDVAGDALKDQAGVHNCELTVDTTLSPAGETITSAAGRKWPARPDDEQGRLIH
jgi:uncharacterized protein (DUF2345 family)